MLSACSHIPGADIFEGGGGGENFAAGSEIGAQLTSADIKALDTAVVTALETGNTQRWSGRRANGEVTPTGYELANLYPDYRKRIALAHHDINLSQVVETDLGLYVLTRNSIFAKGRVRNSRLLKWRPPGGRRCGRKLINKNWMLIAIDDTVRGYVFGNLLIKAPGTELELAGGPHRKPVLCRSFTQRVNMFSSRDVWSAAACNDGTGWTLAEEPPMPEQIADDEC